MRFDIITILPSFFDSFLKESLIQKALAKKLISIRVHNLRNWTSDKHKVVDDKPYGGGPGMVLKFEPLYRAVRYIETSGKKQATKKKVRVVFLSPRGKKFTQTTAKKWAKADQLIIISGRYEGVDERVRKLVDETVSVGDFITLGGEVPAMAIVEAVARLVPGVVGKRGSIKKLDFPQYTRPEAVKIKNQKSKIKNLVVPKVLLSGDHKKIAEWRKKHSKEIR